MLLRSITVEPQRAYYGRLRNRPGAAVVAPVQTLPAYDEQLLKDQKLPTVSQRPTSDVVHTINE